MIYHISWLISAIERCKEENITRVNGNITLEEFMQWMIKDELDKVVVLDK